MDGHGISICGAGVRDVVWRVGINMCYRDAVGLISWGNKGLEGWQRGSVACSIKNTTDTGQYHIEKSQTTKSNTNHLRYSEMVSSN